MYLWNIIVVELHGTPQCQFLKTLPRQGALNPDSLLFLGERCPTDKLFVIPPNLVQLDRA